MATRLAINIEQTNVPSRNVAPVINEYKFSFFLKRWLETILGGLRLSTSAEKTPFYVYLLQFLLFFAPVVVSIVASNLVSSGVFSDEWHGQLLAGFAAGAWIAIVQAIRLVVRRRSSSLVSAKQKMTMFADEDEPDFDSCCGTETLRFILSSNASLSHVLLHVVAAGFYFAGVTWYLNPSRVEDIMGSFKVGYLVLGWFAAAVSTYLFSSHSPPEPNPFRAGDAVWGMNAYMRPVYGAALIALEQVSSQTEVIMVFRILFLVLPLLWTFGWLPPLDALLEWVAEQGLIHLMGGTAAATAWRLAWLVMVGSCACTASFLVFYFGNSAMIATSVGLALGYAASENLVLIRGPFYQELITKTKVVSVYASTSRVLLNIFICAAFIAVGFILHYLDLTDRYVTATWQNLDNRLAWEIVITALFVIRFSVDSLRKPFFLRYFRSPKCLPVASGRYDPLHDLLTWTLRLVITAYLFPALLYGLSNDSASKSFWYCVLMTRALRWTFQSTGQAALEVIEVTWLTRVLNSGSQDQYMGWLDLHLGVQLILAGLVNSRIEGFIKRMEFAIALFTSTWSQKKQRFAHWKPILTVVLIFSPVFCAVIVFCSICAVPILPLLGMPVFIFSFPRPLRLCSSTVRFFATGSDGALYRQLVPSLITELGPLFRKNILDSRCGSFYLVRVDKEVVWIQVLESGKDYVVLQIKGLEQQETTSCHHVEAGKVDDVFEAGLNSNSRNLYASHLLRPLSTVKVPSYEDYKLALTGIIDQRSFVTAANRYFWRSLIYILKKDIYKNVRESWASIPVEMEDLEKVLNQFPYEYADQIGLELPRHRFETPRKNPSRSSALVTPMSVSGVKLDLAHNSVQQHGSHPSYIPSPVNNKSKRHDEFVDDLMDLIDDIDGGGDASRISTKSENRTDDVEQPFHIPSTSTFTPPVNDFDQSAMRTLDMGLKLDTKLLNIPTSTGSGGLLNESDEPEPNPTVESSIDPFVRLVGNLYVIFNMTGFRQESQGSLSAALHYVTGFNGQLTASHGSKWLESEPELRALALKAFRYAVKSAMDEVAAGTDENDIAVDAKEVTATFEEWDKNWFVGSENGDWSDAMSQRKPNLLSLSVSGSTYSAHRLSWNTKLAKIGSLKEEVVRGIWASLVLELMYFTNDDDERFSIQAHPTLLRNLIVQSAEPPLGYPVFASGPISVYF
eukprot:GILK01007559.1.p1 GENE.GILK01007559.1~~GILK01007559.1.p1  ORF type:complete len:1210 (-),score=242.94 GILK01007559.1:314-3874(-)